MTDNKFKNASGARYLRGLFFETSLQKDTVVYTLKDQEHNGFPSLYQLYMSYSDPTEYQFATECLDGWEHWEALRECTWFKPYIERWRREQEVRYKSQALARLMEDSKSTSKSAASSNRFLLEKGWTHDKETKGRPKKEDILKAANDIAADRSRIEEDFERVLGNA